MTAVELWASIKTVYDVHAFCSLEPIQASCGLLFSCFDLYFSHDDISFIAKVILVECLNSITFSQYLPTSSPPHISPPPHLPISPHLLTSPYLPTSSPPHISPPPHLPISSHLLTSPHLPTSSPPHISPHPHLLISTICELHIVGHHTIHSTRRSTSPWLPNTG